MEDEKKEHVARLIKMEKEMEEVFERKVKEKQRKLAETQADLQKKTTESQDKLDQKKHELETRMAVFDKVHTSFRFFYRNKQHFKIKNNFMIF
jgi:septin 7